MDKKNKILGINFPKNINRVLEIGAGSAPHYKFIKHNYDFFKKKKYCEV